MTRNNSGVECTVADPCIRCEHGMPHRAVFLTYDPDAGDYAKKDGRFCVARWERKGDDHAADDICGRESDKSIAGIDLCGYHAERLTAWGFWVAPRRENEKARQELIESQRNLRREVRAEEALRERLREEERERVRAEYSVVYFVRRVEDSAIKIGTTRGFRQRMNALRTEHGELQLLLTLAGDRELEQGMHEKFDLYRKPRTEWFAPTWVLLEWIYSQRRDRQYCGSQFDGVLDIGELRKLVRSAPREETLRWRAGRVMWPQPIAADPAA